MISLPPIQRDPITHWVEIAPDEILFRIYSELSPEDLAACGQTCRRWRNLSQDNMIYQSLAARFHYFDRKDGEAYFQGEKARERFLAIYRNVRGYNLEEVGKSLPPHYDFEDPLDNEDREIFPDFDYWSCRNAIYAYLHLGGAENELGICSRPFLLACYFGDLEMLETISTTKTFEAKSFTILAGAAYAVMGDHSDVVKKIKKMGADLNKTAIFNIPWSEYLLGYAKSDRMRTEISN